MTLLRGARGFLNTNASFANDVDNVYIAAMDFDSKHGSQGKVMKIFISWSGDDCKAVALELQKWLPDLMESVEPWMSEDIPPGSVWIEKLRLQLDQAVFAIICLKKETYNAPWVLFECGAVAKTISDDVAIVPYLIDLTQEDLIRSPLGQFKPVMANKEETWNLVALINQKLADHKVEENRLESRYNRSWSSLESIITAHSGEKKCKRIIAF
ncbi:MAG: hypothetical protein ETSY1_43245 [Candidatus Entotheonella factor]|uniref:TIR domain-containing protein n=1 Tax=Entotheonella factor TaxID=1429438 RepID=W4L351_ENTF1|nr:MAG: hypothetical protein ETSY1_43245 [Candidatus Entotheonella factor]